MDDRLALRGGVVEHIVEVSILEGVSALCTMVHAYVHDLPPPRCDARGQGPFTEGFRRQRSRWRIRARLSRLSRAVVAGCGGADVAGHGTCVLFADVGHGP